MGLLWAQAGFRGDTSALPAGGADAAAFHLPQVPYETLNKRFRAAQKNIDRETSHVTMVVAELEKTLSGCPAVDSVVSLLDGVVEKLSVLKRKVSALPGRAAVPAPQLPASASAPFPGCPGGSCGGGWSPLFCFGGGWLPDPASGSCLHVSWAQDGSRFIISTISPQNSTLAFLFLRMVDIPPK